MMECCNSEIVKIGIVGDGGLAELFITSFVQKEIALNLLDSTAQRYTKNVNISYHNSLSNLARSSSLVITILTDGPELEKILFDAQGVADNMTSSNVIIDMSSVSPELIQEISEQLGEKDIPFLDATIINEDKYESGHIQMMLIGGDKYAFESVLPIFQPIVKTIKHIGENGASQFYRQAFAVRAKR